MTKWLWIVAGPNGAGKSTHTERLIAKAQTASATPLDIIKLNADERTAELKKQFPDRPQNELNLQAARETDAALEKAIAEDKQYILVETVLSSTNPALDHAIRALQKGKPYYPSPNAG
jgi:predicted ABC-type ATPase